MRGITLKMARKRKLDRGGEFVCVSRRNRFEKVEEIKRWGKSWLVITSQGEFVTDDYYQMYLMTEEELVSHPVTRTTPRR